MSWCVIKYLCSKKEELTIMLMETQVCFTTMLRTKFPWFNHVPHPVWLSLDQNPKPGGQQLSFVHPCAGNCMCKRHQFGGEGRFIWASSPVNSPGNQRTLSWMHWIKGLNPGTQSEFWGLYKMDSDWLTGVLRFLTFCWNFFRHVYLYWVWKK